MTSKRFPSKIDLWLVVVLVLVLSTQAYALFSVISGTAPLSAKYTMVGTTTLVYLLVASILLRTHYTVEGGVLTIACGPITRTIKLDEITRVTETRSVLSSPALSLDRLRIQYRKNRSIMISPADKRGFLAAIGLEPAS